MEQPLESNDRLESSMISSSSSTARKLIGRRVGPYVIKGLIAQGGMGAVYEAEHERLHRHVALKTLLAGTSASEEDVQRFLNEARAAASLSHPNLVPIYDVGEAAGIRYLAMELVRGRSLYEALRSEGPMEEEHAVRLIAQAADGLQQAHELGILHRDLKPANILLQESDGAPRITDFGVAKAPGNQRLTATGTALGTPQYMSPEQAMGKNQTLDARSDVYGLGAILYECLTGLPPFTRSSEMETMQAVVNEPVESPRTHRPKLTEEAEAIVLCCLAKRAEHRYPSARALAEDAERYLRGERPHALTDPPEETVVGLSSVKRNVLLVAVVLACTLVGVMLTLVLTLPSLLAERAGGRAEQTAAGWLEARLSAAKASLAEDDPAGWKRASASLEWARVREDVLTDLAPKGAAQVRAAVLRGLGGAPGYRHAAGPIQAELAQRLAGPGPLQAGEEAVAHAIAATVHAPEGEAGKAARLRLAKLLARQSDLGARELAALELSSLARPETAEGVEALLELGRLRANALAFPEAATLLGAALGSEVLDRARRDEAELLLQLSQSFGASAELDAGRVVLGRDKLGSLLLKVGEHTVDLHRLKPGVPLGRPDQTWDLSPKRISVAALGDRDGDGRAEGLLVLEEPGRMYFGVLDLATSGREAFRPVLLANGLNQRVQALATGDVDGDRRVDVAIVFAHLAAKSYVVLGNPKNPVRQLFLRERAPAAFGISSVVMADVDGDGRDEVVVGSSARGAQILDVRSLATGQPQFRSIGSVPLGAVTGLRRVRREKQPDLVLASIDYERAADLPTQRAGRPAWYGRDGLYVIGRGGDGKPALVSRWTFGADEPPSATSVGAAGSVDGWLLRLKETDYLLRSSLARGGGPWRLELHPLEGLSLGASPLPSLTLSCDRPPPPVGQIQVLDVDGDGDAELQAGSRLFGVGPPPEAPLPAPRVVGRARRLLLAASTAHALGRAKEAQGYREQLRREFPGSEAAADEDLRRADALLARAAAAESAAEHLFLRSLRKAGRTRESEARQLYSAAGELADACAARKNSSARASALAGGKASFAWTRAGDRGKALAALRTLLGRPNLGADWRARLEREQHLLTREAGLAKLELDLRANSVRSRLSVARPLRTRLDAGGVSILCGAGVQDSALVGVDLGGGGLPLMVEAELDLNGSAWASSAQVGVFSPVFGMLHSLTGFEIKLSSSHLGGVPECRAKLSGRSIGSAFTLPASHGRVILRLELRPRTGKVGVVVRVFDEERRLLFLQRSAEEVAVTAPRGLRMIGIASPKDRGTHASREPNRFAMESWVRLRRVSMAARSASLRQPTGRSWSLHSKLIYGRPQDAARAYTEILEQRSLRGLQREALWGRALARARAGDARAAEDVVELARRYPAKAVTMLEDVIPPLLEGGDRRELLLVGAAVRALRAERDVVLQVLGRQLSGEFEVTVSPAQAKQRSQQTALCYLAMRNPDAGRDRWRWLKQYQRLQPGGRVPRSRFPPLLDLPTEPMSDERFTSLLSSRGSTGTQRYRALMRAISARPQAAFAWIALAQFYGEAKLLGQAEQALRVALPLARGRLQQATVAKRLLTIQSGLYTREQQLLTVEQLLKQRFPRDVLHDAAKGHLGADPRYQALIGAN